MKTHLIIKLGALGDFVQATTAFKALRSLHAHEQLILLTTKPYVNFAKHLGLFDDIWVDEKPKWFALSRLIDFKRQLRKAAVDTIYDLQGVDRTQFYKWLWRGSHQQWVGLRKNWDHMHPQKRFELLLKSWDVDFSPSLDLKNMGKTDLCHALNQPYVILIPGASSAHGGAKRWPEEHFAEIASRLDEKGFSVVLVGGPGESFPILKEKCLFIKDLVGQTTFFDVIGLGSQAVLTIGNDTGPTLLAASGTSPTMTFYSKFNPPHKGGAFGHKHDQLYRDCLTDLDVDTVWQAVEKMLEVMVPSGRIELPRP